VSSPSGGSFVFFLSVGGFLPFLGFPVALYGGICGGDSRFLGLSCLVTSFASVFWGNHISRDRSPSSVIPDRFVVPVSGSQVQSTG